jgi:hypothetical protein
VRGKIQCNKWNGTNCIAYNTSEKGSCPLRINLNFSKGLAQPGNIGTRWNLLKLEAASYIEVRSRRCAQLIRVRAEQSLANGETGQPIFL